VTLFIVISHETGDDEDGDLETTEHVVVSSDLQHDAEAVRHYWRSINASLKKKRKHWIDSDGAPGHFKNMFMYKFACELKEEIEAAILAWEKCSPGHGKGPWDGLCAVIKCWLRCYELHHKEHGARATFSLRGVFEVLQERGANWVSQLDERHKIKNVTFWYVPVAGEPCLPECTLSCSAREITVLCDAG